MVGSFEHRDVGVVGGDRGEHAIEGVCVRSLVGIVSEDNTGRTSSVCAYKAHRETGIEEGLVDEDHVVISGRSIDGQK